MLWLLHSGHCLTPVASEPLTKRWPVLYTGVTTGFCGCCTTFATWNYDVASTVIKTGDVVGSYLNMLVHVLICLVMLRYART